MYMVLFSTYSCNHLFYITQWFPHVKHVLPEKGQQGPALIAL